MTIYIDFWDVVLLVLVVIILISVAIMEFREDKKGKKVMRDDHD